MLSMSRSNHIAFVIGLAIVAFAAGLALALWGPDGQAPIRVIGALGIATGLFLLTLPRRHLLKRDPELSPDVQLLAEHMVLRRMRILGATGTLMGMAQLLPDSRVKMALMLCSAAASMAAAFKVPRRFFVLEGGAGQER